MPPREYRSRDMKMKSLLIKRMTLVVIATAVALVLSEILLRQIAPIYPTGGMPQAYKYDAELGYRLRPGIHLFRTTDFQQEVRVNELGTANFQDSFEGYDSLVFALGDSFTHGLGVPADMSYPFQLELILNEDEQGLYKKHFGVVNLGTAGFGGEQNLMALNRWSFLLRPPAVVLYLGCDNDYEDDQDLKNGHRHDLPVTDSPYWGRMVPLVQWFNDLQVRLRIKTMSAQMKHARTQAQTGSTETHASVAELEASVLERLAAYAQAHNSLLIVSWSGDGPSYQWLKSWAAGKRVAFADWVPKVQAVQDAIPALPRENQHSGRHYRGWVNHLIAEEFARRIKAH
jgi:hypothetical protein